MRWNSGLSSKTRPERSGSRSIPLGYEPVDLRWGDQIKTRPITLGAGYRGHVLTKTRRYSTTFGALRRARSEWRQAGGRPGHDSAEVCRAGTDDDPDGDEAEIVIERNWRFVGVGFFDVDTAARALASAALAREHRYRRD
jgi:Replication initiator protein, pSAM2